MTRITFTISIMLAFIFASLTGAETWYYKKWDAASVEQKEIQLKIANSQRIRSFTEQLLRRLAVDSQRDPALADFLKKHKVRVVVTPQGAAPESAPESAPTPASAPASAPQPPVAPTPAPPAP